MKSEIEQPNTLASSVFGALREDILSGHLKPKQKLRVDTLRKRYGAGNSPIREALNRLSAEGLVTREEQKGFRVASVGRDDLIELVRTRCLLDGLALRESIANGGEEWEEALVLACHRLTRTKQKPNDDPFEIDPQWEDRHRAFHMALIGGCQSRWLQQYCGQLYDQADRYRRLAILMSFRHRDARQEHQQMTDAALGGDVERATRILVAHYEHTRDIILKLAGDFSDFPNELPAE